MRNKESAGDNETLLFVEIKLIIASCAKEGRILDKMRSEKEKNK